MKKTKDLKRYLEVLYSATYLPMNYFIGGEIAGVYPGWALPLEQFIAYRRDMKEQKRTFHYFETEESLLIGMVCNYVSGESVFFGPVTMTPIDGTVLQRIINQYGVNNESRAAIEEYFLRTPTYSVARFFGILN